MKNWNTSNWFVAATVFAFIGFIAFFNIDSALADEKNWNTELLVGGILSVTAAVLCLLKAKDVSNN